MKFLPLAALIALPMAATLSDPAGATVAAGDPPFLESRACAVCHSNAGRARAMRDEKDRPIAPFDLWRSSMMANSARDPLWRAAVSAEVAATPARRAEIEAKCTRCHTPMAAAGSSEPIGIDLLAGRGRRADLARDGVSCTVCHLIDDVALGTPASFSGHFVVNDRGRVFGPHDDLFTHPMVMHTGLTPERGSHLTRSALCATCHTLFTHTLDEAGDATGARYPEQTPYLEWRNSVFNDEIEEPGPRAASCQECHVPTDSVEGQPLRTAIARNPGGRDFPPVRPRAPFGRHVFVGGNTLVPAILRDNAQALGVTAPAAAFDATIAAARRQLRSKTARLRIERVERTEDELAIVVGIENLTGHKFPSAYPSRRAWLRVRIRDAAGDVVFASGEFDTDGRILTARGAPLASEAVGGPIEPHRDTITSPDAVQIYQVVMSDSDGAPTYRLMRAAKNRKDNRLLPAGWSPGHPDARHTAPVGTADDADFAAGVDTVRYRVRAPRAAGPFRVEVDFLYQTLGARYAAELLRWRTPEVIAFEEYYSRANRGPEVVATAVAVAK